MATSLILQPNTADGSYSYTATQTALFLSTVKISLISLFSTLVVPSFFIIHTFAFIQKDRDKPRYVKKNSKWYKIKQ